MSRTAVLVATLPDVANARVTGLEDGRLVAVDAQGRLTITDSLLNVERGLSTASRGQGADAVRRDLARIALALDDGVRLLDGEGALLRTLRHDGLPGHGSCAFDDDDEHLWAILPRNDGSTDIAVLKLDDLTVADRCAFDAMPAGLTPFHLPSGAGIGWSVGEGQDRALIRWTSFAGGRISLRSAPFEDRVLVAVHPGGGEYLTAPHYDGPLQRHRTGDDEVVGECSSAAGDGWDVAAGYLDAETVLAASGQEEEGLELTVLRREPFDVLGTVIHEGGINAWRTLAWCGRGHWVTTGAAGIEMWSL